METMMPVLLVLVVGYYFYELDKLRRMHKRRGPL